jgi:diguanylate cyclase (GGDEF)-like protein
MKVTPGDYLTDPTRGTLAPPTRRELWVTAGALIALAAGWAITEWTGPDVGMRLIVAGAALAALSAAVLWALVAWVRRSSGPDPLTSTLVLLLLVHLGGFGPPLVVLGILALDKVAAADPFFAPLTVAAAMLAVAGPAAELAWRHWHVRGLRRRAAQADDAAGVADRLAQLEHMANHDSLTGLPNRRHFDRTLRATLQAGHDCAVMLLDLDKFKRINDIHGHAAGDEFLVVVASRLRGELRAQDLPARLGGDEFAVLVCGPASGVAAETLAERIVATMAKPFALANGVVQSGASVGIAASTLHGGDPDVLMERADEAMYTAKAAGGARHAVAKSALTERSTLPVA